jgi:hypothetical protein
MEDEPYNTNMIHKGMHDLVEHFNTKSDRYHDFEGMADAKEVLQVCTDPTTGKYIWNMMSRDPDHSTADEKAEEQLIRSIFLAHLYERADTFGLTATAKSPELMSFDTIVDMYELVTNIVTCRYWSKVTDEHITNIEQSTNNTED